LPATATQPAADSAAPAESTSLTQGQPDSGPPAARPVRLTGPEAALVGSIARDQSAESSGSPTFPPKFGPTVANPDRAEQTHAATALDVARSETTSPPAAPATTSSAAAAKQPNLQVSAQADAEETILPVPTEVKDVSVTDAPASSGRAETQKPAADPTSGAKPVAQMGSDPMNGGPTHGMSSSGTLPKPGADVRREAAPSPQQNPCDVRHTELLPRTTGANSSQVQNGTTQNGTTQNGTTQNGTASTTSTGTTVSAAFTASDAPNPSAASTVTPAVSETLQTLSQAAGSQAASPQDNQQSADRNVATERSTTASLGSAVAGSSTLKTAGEAAPGDTGADHGKERRNAEKTAEQAAVPESKSETASVSAASSAESPLKAAESHSPQSSQKPDAPARLNHHERARVVEQVTRKLDVMRLANGRHETTVHLRPDHLGDLRLTVIADRHDVVTRVVAETAAARDAVMEGREQLRASLEQKGYSLQGLDVSLSNGGQRPFVPYQPAPGQPVRHPIHVGPPAENGASHASASRIGSASRVDGRLDYEA
jgi:hypothetical protein